MFPTTRRAALWLSSLVLSVLPVGIAIACTPTNDDGEECIAPAVSRVVAVEDSAVREQSFRNICEEEVLITYRWAGDFKSSKLVPPGGEAVVRCNAARCTGELTWGAVCQGGGAAGKTATLTVSGPAVAGDLMRPGEETEKTEAVAAGRPAPAASPTPSGATATPGETAAPPADRTEAARREEPAEETAKSEPRTRQEPRREAAATAPPAPERKESAEKKETPATAAAATASELVATTGPKQATGQTAEQTAGQATRQAPEKALSQPASAVPKPAAGGTQASVSDVQSSPPPPDGRTLLALVPEAGGPSIGELDVEARDRLLLGNWTSLGRLDLPCEVQRSEGRVTVSRKVAPTEYVGEAEIETAIDLKEGCRLRYGRSENWTYSSDFTMRVEGDRLVVTWHRITPENPGGTATFELRGDVLVSSEGGEVTRLLKRR